MLPVPAPTGSQPSSSKPWLVRLLLALKPPTAASQRRWKTLLACERTEEAVLTTLRSNAQCALMRIAADRVAA
jgi:hypothetical protein